VIMAAKARTWPDAAFSSQPPGRAPSRAASSADNGNSDLMELNGWSSPQMLRRYGASARSARARRTYDRIMESGP
jgi:hypothetical protein